MKTENIKMSAVKRLIAINRIQNKSFCLHYVCTVYIYYKYTHMHVYILKIFMYLHACMYMHIIYKYI